MMPAKTQTTIARQWQLLKLLPSRGPGKSARELAEALNQEGLQVTKRTVERDLNELMGIFPLYCNDKGTPYGWQWRSDTPFDLRSLSLSEALSLRLLEDFMKPLLPGSILDSLTARFQLAHDKLQKLDDLPTARWADKVRVVLPSLNLLPPYIDSEMQEAVHEALLADKQIEVSYHPPYQEQASVLTLHPLGLVQRGPVTYLVATAFDYPDVRLYAMHRIKEVRRRTEAARQPEGFSLDDYIAHGALQFGNGGTIRLMARVSEWLATILTETPLAADQQLEKVGQEIRLSATVDDTWQLRWWILSLGAEITLLDPEGLRREIGQVLRKAATGYRTAGANNH